MRIEVVRGGPRCHDHRSLVLGEGATAAEAVAASGIDTSGVTALAVFGERVESGRRLRDGDRVEMLGPLQVDPKDARRRRACRHRRRGHR